MREVIVTTSWDDGHKADIKLANLLVKYNLPATFYISPFDREIIPEKRLTDSEIVELSKNFEIGAHTYSHPLLTKISDEEAYEEILSSKTYLENLLKKPVFSFCYPRGMYNKKHIKMVSEMGFKIARNVNRFDFDLVKNPLETFTTVHAYRHWSDIFKILYYFGPGKFLKALLNWDYLAILMFDRVKRDGGVYHLWGHSWEIDNNNDWVRLENVFKYISNNGIVSYKTNTEAYAKQ